MPIEGVDSTTPPTLADAQAAVRGGQKFWGGYLGGSNAASTAYTKADWDTIQKAGLTPVPIWTPSMNDNPTQSANEAIARAKAMGLKGNAIALDTEANYQGNPNLKHFVDGWNATMKKAGYTPVVYSGAHYTGGAINWEPTYDHSNWMPKGGANQNQNGHNAFGDNVDSNVASPAFLAAFHNKGAHTTASKTHSGGAHSGGGHSHPGHAHGGGHSHGGHPGSHGDVKMDPAELGQLGTLLSDGIPSLITGRSAITTALQALGALKDVKELGIPAQVKSLESLGQKAIGDLTPLITGLEGNAQQVAQTKNAVTNADTGTVSPGGQSGLGQTAQQGLTSLAGAGAGATAGAAGANPPSSGGNGPGGTTSGGAPIAPAAAGGGAPGGDPSQGASGPGGDPSQGAGGPGGGDPSQGAGGPGGGDPSQGGGGPGGGDPSQGAGAPGAAPPPPPPGGPGGPGGQPASYTVHHGDNFYKIAEQHMSQGGQHPTHAQVMQYWHKLIAANQNTLPHPGNPNLIMPGEVVNLPPI